VSATASTAHDRVLAAVLAAAALVGALGHLGRPAVAYKALRNLRRSWLSREVALLTAYTACATASVAVASLTVVSALIAGGFLYASARLYVVPGRPAWNTRLTIVRFFATAAAVGPLLTGARHVAAIGGTVALAATAANWWRLSRHDEQPGWGAVRLELRWFRPWTMLRFGVTAAGIVLALGGAPVVAPLGLLALGELLGRWLFFVTVVPLNMPGNFWRGTAAGR
jgi:DMSO reductase anchor subunit